MNSFEQGLLRYFTKEQLVRIQTHRIGIAGAGGLGSNCAHMLVRCGFKQFEIIDFDVIDWSNLNRQFYFTEQVGQPKVDQLKKNLLRINPDAEITTFVTEVDRHSMRNLFINCDIVVEAFDNPACKSMMVSEFINRDTLLIAASGLAGWGNSDDIQTRKIRDKFYIVGDFVSDAADLPPLAPRVHLTAAKQADLILTYVLEEGGKQCER